MEEALFFIAQRVFQRTQPHFRHFPTTPSMASEDIFFAVHGAGLGWLWALREGSAAVELRQVVNCTELYHCNMNRKCIAHKRCLHMNGLDMM